MYGIPPKRRRPLVLPDLTIDGTPLPVVHQCKLLGVHLNSKLDWSTHVAEITKKAGKCLFILIQARKFGFSHASLITLYQWYVRTALEYAAPVWHPGLTEAQHAKIERVQKRCLRIILGAEYRTYEEALERLHLTTLRSRRDMLTLRLGQAMLRSEQYRGLFPPEMGQVHGRNTRHRRRLRPIRCSARYKRTFVPYIVNIVNNL